MANEREAFDAWWRTTEFGASRQYVAWQSWQAASAGKQELHDALILARDHIACSVCHHDETERRGLIWTECLQCGGMFADDEGGVPKPKEPSILAAIRKALGEQS